MKSVPVIVTVPPTGPLIGLTELIVGAFAAASAVDAPESVRAKACPGAASAPTATQTNQTRRARGAAPHIGVLIGTAWKMRNPQTE